MFFRAIQDSVYGRRIFLSGLSSIILFSLAINGYAESSVSHQVADSDLSAQEQVMGLVRLPASTVLATLDQLPAQERHDSNAMIQALYRSGLFANVRVTTQDGKTIITVVERPIINEISVTGNTILNQEEDIDVLLRRYNLVEGRPFDGYHLHRWESDIRARYHLEGYHDALVKSKTTALSRNRVDVGVTIQENKRTKINHIKLQGNQAFSSATLMHELPISETHWWKFYTDSDVYSQAALDNALQVLHQFYYDRGYIDFRVASKTVTPDQENHTVDITIALNEGDLYQVREQKVTGLTGEFKALDTSQWLKLKSGEPFKRSAVVATKVNITNALGDKGYALSRIAIKTNIDREHHQVDVNYQIQPGRPMLVRNIRIHGNGKTDDRVLRSQLIQLEDSIYSHEAMQESVRRLKNLSYIREVAYEVKPNNQSPNWVDIDIQVEETFRTVATVQGGFDNNEGLIFGLQYSQSNFIGSGNKLDLNFQRSDFNNTYSVDYTNPNFTPNGVSLKSRIYYRKTNYDNDDDLSGYVTDSYGYRATFGLPISLHDRISLGAGLEHIYIRDYDEDNEQITDFIDQYGDVYNQLLLILGWTHSSLNQVIFPTSGSKLSSSVDISLPGPVDDIEYYRASAHAQVYWPLLTIDQSQRWLLRYRASLGYGNGYGEYNGDFPFFRNFYAGGINTLRGIRANSAGPEDDDGDATGGNIMLTSGLDLILPTPASRNVRWSLFVDAGNIYEDDADLQNINVTTGVDFLWLSPLGLGIELSYGIPLEYGNDEHHDERFQFSLGTQLM